MASCSNLAVRVRRAQSDARPPAAWLSALCLSVAILAWLAVASASPARALAGQLEVLSCHTPSGAATSVEGWQVTSTGQAYMSAAQDCGEGGQGTIWSEVGASPGGYPNAASIGWVFTAPAWSSIARYTIYLADSDTYQSEAGIDGSVSIAASDEAGSGLYDYRNLDGGLLGATVVERTPPDKVNSISAIAGCDGEGGPCPAGVRIARLDISRSTILLDDPTIPSASQLDGSLVSGAPLTGTAEVSFLASDSGPGVYSAWLAVDGQTEQPVLLDSNAGKCVTLGQSSEGTPEFASSTPCTTSASGTLKLNSATLRDGQHALQLIVADASGNTATVWSGSITTNNAPQVQTAPDISGTAQVGSTLTGSPATFTSPEGAGALSVVSGQWLRCSNQQGTDCAPIAGASAATYTPTASDIGYCLVYQSSTSNNDGSASSNSPPTLAVSEPAKEAASAGGQSSPGDVGGAGGSGGAASGAAAGATGALNVQLSTPAGGLLGSTAPWQISLRTSRRRVRKGMTIRLTGAVNTQPRPEKGKLIWLRARSVRLKPAGRRGHAHRVPPHGKWITFAVLRTGVKGRYLAKHRFRIGGRHVYQFQAIAPQEAGYLNATGTSRVLSVHEHPSTRRHASRSGR